MSVFVITKIHDGELKGIWAYSFASLAQEKKEKLQFRYGPTIDTGLTKIDVSVLEVNR